MSDTYTVYAIVNTQTEKRYIGITINPSGRKKTHFRNLLVKRHHSKKLQSAYDINPNPELFKWEILETGVSLEYRNRRELYWMEFYNSIADGYNMEKPKDDTDSQNILAETRARRASKEKEAIEISQHLHALEDLGLSDNSHFVAIKEFICKIPFLADAYHSETLADYVTIE